MKYVSGFTSGLALMLVILFLILGTGQVVDFIGVFALLCWGAILSGVAACGSKKAACGFMVGIIVGLYLIAGGLICG
jgi:hypothetical protein